MKKISLVSVLFISVILGFSFTPAFGNEKAFPKIVSIGTGSIGGAYNMVGVTVSKYWNKDIGLRAKVIPGLNLSNLVRFDKGNMDMIVSASSWGLAAWEGREDFGFTKPIRSFRVLCYIYDDIWYFVSLKKSGLNNISDLKGKRVGCGAKAAVFDKIIGNRIEANGLKYFGEDTDIKKVYTSWQDMARLLGDGRIDAILGGISGSVPHPAIRELMEENDLTAVEFNKAAIEYESKLFPVGVIKKDQFPFLEKDYYGINAGRASIVIREDFSDDFAYMLTKTIHENLKKMGEENPYWQYADKHNDLLTYESGLPYHPGAIKYWKEIGAWKR